MMIMTKGRPTNAQVLALIEHCFGLVLECDGMTRVMHTILEQAGIRHQVMAGRLTCCLTGQGVFPHFWIELETVEGKHLIDLCAGLWFPSSDIDLPRGLFQAARYPHLRYQGEALTLAPLSGFLHEQLLAQRSGLFLPCGYQTPGASAYFQDWMRRENTLAVECRFTPFAHKTRKLPDSAIWCRFGPRGLAATYRERYLYLSNKTQGRPATGDSKEDRLNWLGNRNYKNGGPITLVNEREGLRHLQLLLGMGWNVIGICGCEAQQFDSCHLSYIARRLQGLLPGLEVRSQLTSAPDSTPLRAQTREQTEQPFLW